MIESNQAPGSLCVEQTTGQRFCDRAFETGRRVNVGGLQPATGFGARGRIEAIFVATELG